MGITRAMGIATAHSVWGGQIFRGERSLVVVECPQCFIMYAIPTRLQESARDYPGDKPNGWKIHCPMGHWWYYPGRSIEQELEAARNQAATARAERDQYQASARAYQGHATRARKKLAKVTAGVCPVDGCHRHFTNLQRHIAAKHPDYPGAHP